MNDQQTPPLLQRMALVVLAAGQSSRMGMPKALAVLEGRTLLKHLLDAARSAGLSDLIVVLGHQGGQVAPIVGRCGARGVLNLAPEHGRTGSVQTGLSFIPPGAVGAFIQPVDCPLVAAATYAALASALGDADVVVPSHRGAAGHPPLIARRLFSRILAARPDAVLRDLLEGEGVRRVVVEVDDAGVLVNVNTPDDLRRVALERERRSGGASNDQ